MDTPVEIDWFWMALKILAVLLLVALNGFFVAAEFALVKVRGTQLQPLVYEGQRRAKVAHYILNNLDAFLSACQLGITLASLALGWIGEPIFETLLQPIFHWLAIESETAKSTISFGFGFSVITILHIVVGEIAPKSLAIQKPLPTSLWVAYPMMWFYRIILSIRGGSQLGFSTTSQTCRNRNCCRIARASFRRGTATARHLEQRAGQALTARPQHCDERARSRQPHRTRSHATPNKHRRPR